LAGVNESVACPCESMGLGSWGLWRLGGSLWGGKSFDTLAEALHNALTPFRRVPAEHPTDSLSACFRNRDGNYAGNYTSGSRVFWLIWA